MLKAAERFIILRDAGAGLCARLYNLTENGYFQRPASLGADVDNVCKTLVKKYPDLPASLEKVAGYDNFKRRSQDIVAELKAYYSTMVATADFVQEACKLLQEVAISFNALDVTAAPDLVSLVMDLLVALIRVLFLVGLAQDWKLHMSSYAKAFALVHGNSEPAFLRLAQFYDSYFESDKRSSVVDKNLPFMEKLREDLAALELSIGPVLVGFTATVMKWASTESLLQVFNLLERPGSVAKFKEHTELLMYHRLLDYVLLGFLVLPGPLQNPDAQGLLKIALTQTLRVRVFRNIWIDIHEAHAALFSNFRDPKTNKTSLSKSKKLVKEARKDAETECFEQHSRLRNILRAELRSAVAFARDQRGCIPPKFFLLLSLLRLSAEEVIWHLVHSDLIKASKKEDSDERLSEIIFLAISLRRAILRDHNLVQKFYLQLLSGPVSSNFAAPVQNFAASGKAAPPVLDLLKTVRDQLAACKPEDFEALRLNVYRILVAINTSQGGMGPRESKELNEHLTIIAYYARNVDRVENQLRKQVALSEIYFFREDVQNILNQGLEGIDGQPRYMMALCEAMNLALEAVHRLCPEEQSVIGTRAVQRVSNMLSAISKRVESLLSGLLSKYESLRAQTAPKELVDRMQRPVSHLPGYESLHANRGVVNTIRIWRQQLAEICTSAQESELVVVYNVEFAPREIIIGAVSRVFQAIITSIVYPSGQSGSLERPSVIRSRVTDLLLAVTEVGRHIPMDISEAVREVLYLEFAGIPSKTGAPGEPVPPLADDIKLETTLVGCLASWYVNVMNDELEKHRITFSDHQKSFVSLAGASFHAEYYFSFQELQDLASLIGASGVRLFDSVIMRRLQVHLGHIKNVLEDNKSILQTMRGQFYLREPWLQGVSKLRELDKLTGHSVIMGQLLCFRSLLHQSLSETLQRSQPLIYQSVSNVFRLYPYNSKADGRTLALDLVAADCGVDVKTADHTIRWALKDFKRPDTPWDLLPELYGASFVASNWKNCTYLIETESHNNNVNCVATTIATLISVFSSIQLEGEKSVDVEATITAQMESFARCASFSILHMSHPDNKEQFGSYPFQSIMAFVEKFILSSGGRLDHGLVEDFFPFTLLRTCYIQMYERQTVKGRTFAAMMDDETKDE